MIVVADLSVPSSAFLFPDALASQPAVELNLVELVPTGEHPIPYCWVAGPDHAVASFAKRAESASRVESLAPLERREQRVLYRIEWEGPPGPLVEALQTNEVLVDRATGTGDGWEFRLQCPDHERLSQFRQTCVDNDVDVRVDRVYRPTSDDPDPVGLTTEQREALVLARREGYFDVPRGITLEELGTMLGISRQAVSNRLRRGTRHLVDEVVLSDRS